MDEFYYLLSFYVNLNSYKILFSINEKLGQSKGKGLGQGVQSARAGCALQVTPLAPIQSKFQLDYRLNEHEIESNKQQRIKITHKAISPYHRNRLVSLQNRSTACKVPTLRSPQWGRTPRSLRSDTHIPQSPRKNGFRDCYHPHNPGDFVHIILAFS